MSDKTPQLTPEQIELEWFNNVYQGDKMPQLTLRAVLMGAFLGGFMSLSNLYVGLKTGWALGVAITACVLSFVIHKTMRAAFPKIITSDMTILENNCMQSTASSAGYSTGGTIVSAVSAYLLLTGEHIPWPILIIWTFFLASLGVFLAVPMKRQMINIEKLRFPSGIAAAETLRSLHSKGTEAVVKAKALGIAALSGGVIAWIRDAGWPFSIPSHLHFPGSIGGVSMQKLTISFELSPLMIAAGALVGWKVAWSLLLGATINWGILAPWMINIGAIEGEIGYRSIISWSTWAGASMMVTSGLFYFFLQGKSALYAISDLRKMFKPRSTNDRFQQNNPMQKIEVPGSWFVLGTLISGVGIVCVLYFAFETSILMGIIAVIMSFFLSLVACRVTGESDMTPMGAMGKITQLTYGILAPSKVITNLMTAGATAGAAASSADLLTDLKSGYVLGANPRKQFIAQYLGIIAGCLVVIPAFYILVPTADSLGTDRWPAPAAQVWKAVAELLASGFGALHPTARWGLLIGGMFGVILPLIEIFIPQKLRKFVPSATGVGLSMVIHFYYSFAMFIGALIALISNKKAPLKTEIYLIPICSGLIAGESLLGVLIALLSSAGFLG